MPPVSVSGSLNFQHDYRIITPFSSKLSIAEKDSHRAYPVFVIVKTPFAKRLIALHNATNTRVKLLTRPKISDT